MRYFLLVLPCYALCSTNFSAGNWARPQVEIVHSRPLQPYGGVGQTELIDQKPQGQSGELTVNAGSKYQTNSKCAVKTLPCSYGVVHRQKRSWKTLMKNVLSTVVKKIPETPDVFLSMTRYSSPMWSMQNHVERKPILEVPASNPAKEFLKSNNMAFRETNGFSNASSGTQYRTLKQNRKNHVEGKPKSVVPTQNPAKTSPKSLAFFKKYGHSYNLASIMRKTTTLKYGINKLFTKFDEETQKPSVKGRGTTEATNEEITNNYQTVDYSNLPKDMNNFWDSLEREVSTVIPFENGKPKIFDFNDEGFRRNTSDNKRWGMLNGQLAWGSFENLPDNSKVDEILYKHLNRGSDVATSWPGEYANGSTPKFEDRKPGVMYDLFKIDLTTEYFDRKSFDSSTISVHSDIFKTGFVFNKYQRYPYGPYPRGDTIHEFHVSYDIENDRLLFYPHFDRNNFKEGSSDIIPRKCIPQLKFNWDNEKYLANLYLCTIVSENNLIKYIKNVTMAKAKFDVNQVLLKLVSNPTSKFTPLLMKEIFNLVPRDNIKAIVDDIKNILANRAEIKSMNHRLLYESRGNLKPHLLARLRNRVLYHVGIYEGWSDPMVTLFFEKMLEACPKMYDIAGVQFDTPQKVKLWTSLKRTNMRLGLKLTPLMTVSEVKYLSVLHYSVKVYFNQLMGYIVNDSEKSDLIRSVLPVLRKRPTEKSLNKLYTFIVNHVSKKNKVFALQTVKRILKIIKQIKWHEKYLLKRNTLPKDVFEKTVSKIKKLNHIYDEWSGPLVVEFYRRLHTAFKSMFVIRSVQISPIQKKCLWESLSNARANWWFSWIRKKSLTELHCILQIYGLVKSRENTMKSYLISCLPSDSLYLSAQLNTIQNNPDSKQAHLQLINIIEQVPSKKKKIIAKDFDDIEFLLKQIDFRSKNLLKNIQGRLYYNEIKNIKYQLKTIKDNHSFWLSKSIETLFKRTDVNNPLKPQFEINDLNVSPENKKYLWRAVLSGDHNLDFQVRMKEISIQLYKIQQLYITAKYHEFELIEKIQKYTKNSVHHVNVVSTFKKLRKEPQSKDIVDSMENIYKLLSRSLIFQITQLNLEKRKLSEDIKLLEDRVVSTNKARIPEDKFIKLKDKLEKMRRKFQIYLELFPINVS